MEDQNLQEQLEASIDEGQETPEVADTPSTLKIGDKEYSLDDAQELIGLGNKTREIEQKYNTKMDNVYPAYTRTTQENKTLKADLETARGQLQQFESKKDAGTETSDDVVKAKEAARKLGITLNEDLDKSYVKRDDLDKYFNEKMSQEKSVEKILNQADTLEKEIDGSDGRPKFSKRAILPYARAYGIPDLKEAYEDMHKDTLTSWKEAQVAQVKKPGLKTMTTSKGNKEPVAPSITKDNLKDQVTESLGL